MDLTIDTVFKGLSILSLVFTAAVSFLILRLRPEFASRATAEDHAERLDHLEQEVVLLREKLSNVPTQADIERISDRMSELSGDVKGLRGTVDMGFKGIQEQLSLLMEHHIAGGR